MARAPDPSDLPIMTIATFGPLEAGTPLSALHVAVQRVVAAWDADGYRFDLHHIHLPRSYRAAAEAVRATLGTDPKAAPALLALLDLAPDAEEYLLENLAANLADDPRPDTEGVVRTASIIDPEGPVAYRSRLPLDGIWDKLTVERVPVRMSHKAGTHVYNATLYAAHRHAHLAGLATRIGGIRAPGRVASTAGPEGDVTDPGAGHARADAARGDPDADRAEPDAPAEDAADREADRFAEELAMVLGVAARLAEVTD